MCACLFLGGAQSQRFTAAPFFGATQPPRQRGEYERPQNKPTAGDANVVSTVRGSQWMEASMTSRGSSGAPLSGRSFDACDGNEERR